MRITGVSFVLALAACLGISAPVPSPADGIRIGAILPLTGGAAANGLSMHDGIQLAVDEINRRGGVNGNMIDVAFEDSRGDPRAAVEAFTKLEVARPPLFYLCFLSTVGVALGPLTDEKGVVLVGLSTSAPAFTRGRQLVYQYWPSVQADIPPLLGILRDLKVKSLGIIYSNEEFGKAEEEPAARGFAEAGGVTILQAFEAAETDFRRQISAVMSMDGVFVATYGISIMNAIRQLKQAGYRGRILTPAGGATPAFAVAPEMQGVYVVAPIIYNLRYLFAREAGEKYAGRFQRPIDHWSASGYDFIKLVAGLLEDRPLSRKSVGDALGAGFEYSGVFGPVHLPPGEHVIGFPMYPAQIVDNMLRYR
jgi:branched-chain amino acid transport system substrate-binding protein